MTDKPVLTTFGNPTPLDIQKYKRYLPTAFDESLSLLEKVNKVIDSENNVIDVMNDVVTQVNAVQTWALGDGLQQDVDTKLDEMANDGTLANIINVQMIGSLSDLKTTHKDNLVNAINDNYYEVTESTGYGVINGLKVTAQATPNMSVLIPAGIIHLANGNRYDLAEINSLPITTSDATQNRIDIVYVSGTGVVSYLAGALGSGVPATPTDGFKLAEITVNAGVSSIVSNDIKDTRLIKLNNNALSSLIGNISKNITYIDDSKYGADLTGNKDSTTAILNALNDASLNGGYVCFPDGGVLLISTDIIVPNGIKALFGNSTVKSLNGSKIIFQGSASSTSTNINATINKGTETISVNNTLTTDDIVMISTNQSTVSSRRRELLRVKTASTTSVTFWTGTVYNYTDSATSALTLVNPYSDVNIKGLTFDNVVLSFVYGNNIKIEKVNLINAFITADRTIDISVDGVNIDSKNGYGRIDVFSSSKFVAIKNIIARAGNGTSDNAFVKLNQVANAIVDNVIAYGSSSNVYGVMLDTNYAGTSYTDVETVNVTISNVVGDSLSNGLFLFGSSIAKCQNIKVKSSTFVNSPINLKGIDGFEIEINSDKVLNIDSCTKGKIVGSYYGLTMQSTLNDNADMDFQAYFTGLAHFTNGSNFNVSNTTFDVSGTTDTAGALTQNITGIKFSNITIHTNANTTQWLYDAGSTTGVSCSNVPSMAQSPSTTLGNVGMGGGSLTSVFGISGSTTKANNFRGIGIGVSSGTTSVTFTFPTPEPDANYALIVTPYWATAFGITSKTANDFTVSFTTAPTANTGLDYLLIR